MTTTTESVLSTKVYAPPPPIVTFREHKLRWVGQGILRLVWAAILGHVFLWMWIATYFIITQNHWVKPYWDSTIRWDLLRHFIRDYGESLFATTAVWFALYNRWTKKNRKLTYTAVERAFDKIGLPSRAQREPTHGWQYVLALPLTLAASAPGAAFGFLVLYLLDRYDRYLRGAIESSGAASTTLLEKYLTAFRNDVPIKVAGVVGGIFFARVVFNKIAGDGQKAFARRRAVKRLGAQHWWTRFLAKPRWPLPAPYRAEYTMAMLEYRVRQQLGQELPKRAWWVALIQLLLIPAVLALAWYGWHIITVIAVHH